MTNPTANNPPTAVESPVEQPGSDRIPVENLHIPESWAVEAENSRATTVSDVLITGPTTGQYISVDVKPGKRVHVTYVPSGYDKTRIANPSYRSFVSTIDEAVSIVNEFFDTRDADAAFDRKTT